MHCWGSLTQKLRATKGVCLFIHEVGVGSGGGGGGWCWGLVISILPPFLPHESHERNQHSNYLATELKLLIKRKKKPRNGGSPPSPPTHFQTHTHTSTHPTYPLTELLKLLYRMTCFCCHSSIGCMVQWSQAFHPGKEQMSSTIMSVR